MTDEQIREWAVDLAENIYGEAATDIPKLESAARELLAMHEKDKKGGADNAESLREPLHSVVQECIDNFGKYYAEHHKLGMSVRDDMAYVALVAVRWGLQDTLRPTEEAMNPTKPTAEPMAETKLTEEGWGMGPDGDKDVLAFINETPMLLSLLYDLNLLPEQHPDHESPAWEKIFTITNHWREEGLRVREGTTWIPTEGELNFARGIIAADGFYTQAAVTVAKALIRLAAAPKEPK